MMKCSACGHENVDGTMFCEMCGEDMQSADSAAAGAVSTPTTTASDEIKCPACENMNPAENLVCEICGTELRSVDSDAEEAATATSVDTASIPVPAAAPTLETTPFDAPAADTPATAALNDVAAAATAAPDTAPDTAAAPDASAAPSAPGAPILPGTVKLVVEQGMTIGKQFVLSDPEIQVGREDADEDIYPDIDLADQDEGYVHRKHATLKFENDQLLVTHLGGANKTRINNKPIPDNAPQATKLGDKIAFGKVVLRLMPL